MPKRGAVEDDMHRVRLEGGGLGVGGWVSFWGTEGFSFLFVFWAGEGKGGGAFESEDWRRVSE